MLYLYHIMEIIGISGPPCSGKDAAAEYASSRYGFKRVSTGDLLRAKARELDIPTDRTSLQILGTKLRSENNGKDPILATALANMQQGTIFTGIRTTEAAASIVNVNSGKILYLDSPVEDRYMRSIERARGDHPSFEEFLKQDKAEHEGTLNIDTSLFAIKALATRVIMNNSTIENLYAEIDNFILEYCSISDI